MPFLSKRWSEWGVISLFVPVLAVTLTYTGALRRADNFFYDWQLRLSPRSVVEDIAVVAIDDRSLAALGRWPWSRRRHAQLLDRLSRVGVRAIGLDVLFAEPDTQDPESDRLLAEAIRRNGRVVLAVGPEPGPRPGEVQVARPLPGFVDAAAGLGHADLELDEDGIARSSYLKAGLGSPHWSVLPLAMLELAEAKVRQDLPGELNPATHHAADKWVRDHKILVHFAGPSGRFHQYSYVDVLHDDKLAARLRGKLVLIGMLATGLVDTYATPVANPEQRPMAGVEIWAHVLDTLVQNASIRPLPKYWQLSLTAVLVLWPLLLYGLLKPRWALPAAAATLLMGMLASFLLLRLLHLWFAPGPAMLALVLSYPLWSWRRLESALRSLFQEKGRAKATLHSIGDAVITTDPQGSVEYMNPVAQRLTGYAMAEATGQPLHEVFRLLNAQGEDERIDLVGRALDEGAVIKLSKYKYLQNKAGGRHAIRITASPIAASMSKVPGVVLAFSDISETVAMTQQIAHQANHDALTGLPNRNLLQNRIEEAIAHAEHSGEKLAILFVDLDGFKKVNDGLGHTAGDVLLTAVATRLRAIGGHEKTVARWGGDEFIVLIESLVEEEPMTAAAAQQVIEILAQPFEFDGQEVCVTASIGISLYPKDGASAQELLKKADIAMYRGKDQGRNTYLYYSHGGEGGARERLILEQELRRALKGVGLEVHYQPQQCLSTGRVVGTEVLLRWQHPELGTISPAKFIPLAEETGLIQALGEFALSTACRQAKAWLDQGLPAIPVSVNLSPRQFMQKNLCETVERILRETGLPPTSLKLEITEGAFLHDFERITQVLGKLREWGVSFAVDDFGTGYSSLSYLKRLPIDQIKIDKAFINDVNVNPDDAAIVEAIIAMAHRLKLQVIAEGVETAEQYRFLQQEGCDAVQGYFFSRPLKAEDVMAMLAKEPVAGQARNARSVVGF